MRCVESSPIELRPYLSQSTPSCDNIVSTALDREDRERQAFELPSYINGHDGFGTMAEYGWRDGSDRFADGPNQCIRSVSTNKIPT